VDLGRLIVQSLTAVRHTVSSAEQLLDTPRQFAMLVSKIATSDDPGIVTADSGLARAPRGGCRAGQVRDLFVRCSLWACGRPIGPVLAIPGRTGDRRRDGRRRSLQANWTAGL